MAIFNLKSKLVGDILTFTIDLSKDCGPTEKGNKSKVATAFWNDAIPNMPEGFSMSMVILKPINAKKAKKVAAPVEEEEVEEKPVAKKTTKKVASKVLAKKIAAPAAKPTTKKIVKKAVEEKPVAKKTTKKIVPVAANDREDQEQDAFAPAKKTGRKLRAA